MILHVTAHVTEKAHRVHFSSHGFSGNDGKTRHALEEEEWWVGPMKEMQVLARGKDRSLGHLKQSSPPSRFLLTNWVSDIHWVIFPISPLRETIWNHPTDLCRPFSVPTSLLIQTHRPSSAPADLHSQAFTVYFWMCTLCTWTFPYSPSHTVPSVCPAGSIVSGKKRVAWANTKTMRRPPSHPL